MNFLPENDGIDHINVYSKGKTQLGKFLSNFTLTPILTSDGKFSSIEGYWYWLGCEHKDKEVLRDLSGFRAKQVGRELRAKDWQDSNEFKEKILAAIKIKINTYPYILKLFKENKLPFTHYYVYGDKVIDVPGAKWILDGIEKIKHDN
jgi:hypothetical protein